jgi:transcriptional regulator with PAS, ATPase and Fis domain
MMNEEPDFTNARILRMKAEELLQEKLKKTAKPIFAADEKKLLHELQVHQVELEMQNEELRQAYATTETALKKYTMLYDLAPVGYFTLDSTGTILELNFTAAEMLRERRFSLVNSNFKLFISKNSMPVFNDFFNNVFTSYGKESCEVMLGEDKDRVCPVYVEGIVTGDDQNCLLSVVDISKFNKSYL